MWISSRHLLHKKEERLKLYILKYSIFFKKRAHRQDWGFQKLAPPAIQTDADILQKKKNTNEVPHRQKSRKARERASEIGSLRGSIAHTLDRYTCIYIFKYKYILIYEYLYDRYMNMYMYYICIYVYIYYMFIIGILYNIYIYIYYISLILRSTCSKHTRDTRSESVVLRP